MPSDTSTLMSLLTQDIKDWYHLGSLMGIQIETLRTIQRRYPNNYERAKAAMLKEWLLHYEYIPWIELATALNQLGYKDSAYAILENIHARKLMEHVGKLIECNLLAYLCFSPFLYAMSVYIFAESCFSIVIIRLNHVEKKKNIANYYQMRIKK